MINIMININIKKYVIYDHEHYYYKYFEILGCFKTFFKNLI